MSSPRYEQSEFTQRGSSDVEALLRLTMDPRYASKLTL
jgi:hypothetical protein